MLRPGLLEGLAILVAGPASSPSDRPAEGVVQLAVFEGCEALGAAVRCCCPIAARTDEAGEVALEGGLAAAIGDAGAVDVLAVDGAGLFAHGLASGGGGHAPGSRAALRTCMDATWNVTRAVANCAFLARPDTGEDRREGRGGRIVYLAPAPDAGGHAEAACAGLENLARTLSIEWARHGVAAVTIAPGAETAAGELAALTGYLASSAGAYFSGCLLDLRGP